MFLRLLHKVEKTVRQFLNPLGTAVWLVVQIVIFTDSPVDAQQYGQAQDITVRESSILDSAEDTIPKMVHLFHGTALAGKYPVSLC